MVHLRRVYEYILLNERLGRVPIVKHAATSALQFLTHCPETQVELNETKRVRFTYRD